jgi:hypothetical protein
MGARQSGAWEKRRINPGGDSQQPMSTTETFAEASPLPHQSNSGRGDCSNEKTNPNFGLSSAKLDSMAMRMLSFIDT